MPITDRPARPPRHPRADRELGGVARQPASGTDFRTVWHPEGRMMATWFQGTSRSSSRSASEGYDARRAHPRISSAACSIDIKGKRAIAQTKMSISQRARRRRRSATWSAPAASTTSWRSARAAGASCCASRSTRRTASTRSIRPQAPKLDPKLLDRFPEGYRHLAYLQTKIGYKVKTRHAGRRRPASSRRSTRAARPGLPAKKSDNVSHTIIAVAKLTGASSPTIDHSVTRITHWRRRRG